MVRKFESDRDWKDFQMVFSQFNGMTVLSMDMPRLLKWMQAAFEEMGRQNIRNYTLMEALVEMDDRLKALEALKAPDAPADGVKG